MKIPKTTPTLLKDERSMFVYFDSDFDTWKLDDKGKATEPLEVDVRILTEDKTFAQIFNTETDCLTQAQILAWIKENKETMEKYTWYFFLFKNKDNFFVAIVHVHSDGLDLDVREVSYSYVWCGSSERRFVLPADFLTLTSGSPDTLTLDSLSRRVSELEKTVDKLTRIINV